MSAIRPVHPSVRVRLAKGERLHPYKMDTLRMPRDTVEGLTVVALDIFSDCVNVGVPFQEAILAVYLSGLNHGSEIRKEIQ